MIRLLLPLFALTLITSCSPRLADTTVGDQQLDEVTRLMAGHYSSAAQASIDEAYYDINLHVTPIWPDRGHFLYMEQTLAVSPTVPYRQVVYKLNRKGRKIILTPYGLPQPDQLTNAHQLTTKFNQLKPSELISREGCAIVLKAGKDGLYRGGTRRRSCQSNLSGATYAQARLNVADSFIQTWERGFNDAGDQVWGPTNGGYMFFREE